MLRRKLLSWNLSLDDVKEPLDRPSLSSINRIIGCHTEPSTPRSCSLRAAFTPGASLDRLHISRFFKDLIYRPTADQPSSVLV